MRNYNDNGISRQIRLSREQGHQEGIRFTIKNYSSVLLLCLKDKFGFTTEQLQQVSAHINDIFDSVCEGYLTLEDIAEILKEENDIDITFSSEKERQAEVEKYQGFLVVGRGNGKSGRVLEKLREELGKEDKYLWKPKEVTVEDLVDKVDNRKKGLFMPPSCADQIKNQLSDGLQKEFHAIKPIHYEYSTKPIGKVKTITRYPTGIEFTVEVDISNRSEKEIEEIKRAVGKGVVFNDK